MNINDQDPKMILDALARGGLSDLRAACDFADKIVDAVERAGDTQQLERGFKTVRARNDYYEEEIRETGHINTRPLSNSEMGAPPKEKTQIGRFNAPLHPVLYLSSSPEIALAEIRALSTDMCTVAIFETKRDIKLAKLLVKGGFPIDAFLSEKPSTQSIESILLYHTAKFVSRRVPDKERELHYRACGLIGSAFKERGFDGLAYRTSFWFDGWSEKGRSTTEDSIRSANVVLFDPDLAEPTLKGRSLYKIDWKRPQAQRIN